MLGSGLDQRGGKKRRDAVRNEKLRKAAFVVSQDSPRPRRGMVQSEARELFDAVARSLPGLVGGPARHSGGPASR